jgi:hypothetical protein
MILKNGFKKSKKNLKIKSKKNLRGGSSLVFSKGSAFLTPRAQQARARAQAQAQARGQEQLLDTKQNNIMLKVEQAAQYARAGPLRIQKIPETHNMQSATSFVKKPFFIKQKSMRNPTQKSTYFKLSPTHYKI